ncbi:hypothetical protein H5410_041631 [Solanum commersonii]|uniref:Uncharacterized protein n=1 Tax=Solanum commersonii TaxID=4109 RepID=A0A9J5XTF6_SOLCO|nr:hypothetical protein H5410_041631 [Solanum commersonii]
MRSQVQISVDTKALGDFFSCVVASVNRVSYLILVVGERGKISHGVSRGAHKLTQPPRLSKKKREQKGWGGSLALREEAWWEIASARGLISSPWVVSIDFNTVRHPLEKKNCNRINKSMTDFSEFIEDMELIDLDLTCGQFTWKQGDR